MNRIPEYPTKMIIVVTVPKLLFRVACKLLYKKHEFVQQPLKLNLRGLETPFCFKNELADQEVAYCIQNWQVGKVYHGFVGSGNAI